MALVTPQIQRESEIPDHQSPDAKQRKMNFCIIHEFRAAMHAKFFSPLKNISLTKMKIDPFCKLDICYVVLTFSSLEDEK